MFFNPGDIPNMFYVGVIFTLIHQFISFMFLVSFSELA